MLYLLFVVLSFHKWGRHGLFKMGYLSANLPRKYFSLSEAIKEIEQETDEKLSISDIIHFVKNGYPFDIYVLSDYIDPIALYLMIKNPMDDNKNGFVIDINFSDYSIATFSNIIRFNEFHCIDIADELKQFIICSDLFSFQGLLAIPNSILKETDESVKINEGETLRIIIDDTYNHLEIKNAWLQINESVTIQYSNLYINDRDLILLIKEILGRKKFDYGFNKIKENDKSNLTLDNSLYLLGEILTIVKSHTKKWTQEKLIGEILQQRMNQNKIVQGLEQRTIEEYFATANKRLKPK